MNTVLDFQPLGPIWMEVAVILLTVLVFAYSIYGTKHHPTKLRILLGSLRFFLLGTGLFLLHHPTITSKKVEEQEHKLAVLVDRSGSMGTDSEGGKTRYEKAWEVVSGLKEQGFSYDVFEFDQSLSDSLGKASKPRKLSGNKTDFYGSMTQLFRENSDYTGVLLLSDGHDLGRFSQMSSDETSNWLKRLNAPPINTVLTGDQLDGPEVAIHSIDAPPFSFVRAPVRISATIIVRNLDGFSAQVQLLDGDQVIQIKELVLDDQGFGKVEFEFYPEEEGEKLYTLVVPPHHLENNVENNRQQVLIDVGRDKINILHIAGSITWDLQGLRAMFERNPMVDLTAFYIMRTRDHLQQGVDNRLIPPDEMALVPFPTEEIFDRQLFGFDVVIFHDFDAGTYFSDSYQARRLMKKIREFVTEHHGGFVVIGGPRTASGPSLGLTPLAEIIPLVPPIQRIGYDEKDREPRLTQKGEKHPIFRQFEPDYQVFSGSMESLTINKKGNVLLEDKGGKPLMATAEIGNGRTLFLNTSSSWKWRRDALSDGKTGEHYYDFWDQTLKWMIQDPSMNQTRLSVVKTVSNPLATEIDILLRDQNFESVDNGEAQLIIKALDGKSDPVTLTFNTDSKGNAQLNYTAERPGYYQLSFAQDKWNELSTPVTLFLGGSQEELRNLDLVPETLQRMASFAGGHFSSTTSRFDADNLAWGELQEQTIVETRRLKIRNWIWSLPILLLIAGLEWALRRSRHLA